MLKTSKIGVLILYPLQFILGIALLGRIFFTGPAATDGDVIYILLKTLLVISPIILIIFSIMFGYASIKEKLFSKNEEGKRRARFSDYAALVFVFLFISDLLQNLIRLIS